MGLFDLFGPPNVEKMKRNKNVLGLIKALNDKDWRIRRVAIEALGEIGDNRAIEPCISALRDDYGVQYTATVALEKLRPDWPSSAEAIKQIPEFILALNDPDEYVREGAAKALVSIGKPAVMSLIAATDGADKNMRGVAVRALGLIGDIRAMEPLITALNDQDGFVRKWAAEALENIDSNWPKSETAQKQVPKFIAGLKENDRSMRIAAAKALGLIGNSRAVEPLIATLKEQDESVRSAIAEALGVIGDARAVAPLIAVTEALDDATLKVVIGALVKIVMPAVEPLISAFKDRLRIRIIFIEILGELGDPRTIEFIKASQDDDEDNLVRLVAKEAVLKLENASEFERKGARTAIEREKLIRSIITKIGDFSDIWQLMKRAGISLDGMNYQKGRVMNYKITLCDCGYPIWRTFHDGSGGPMFEILNSSSGGYGSTDYSCPNCGKHVGSSGD